VRKGRADLPRGDSHHDLRLPLLLRHRPPTQLVAGLAPGFSPALWSSRGEPAALWAAPPQNLPIYACIPFSPPAGKINFGSVSACTRSAVVSGAISRSTKPSGVTSITASSVTM